MTRIIKNPKFLEKCYNILCSNYRKSGRNKYCRCCKSAYDDGYKNGTQVVYAKKYRKNGKN